MNVLKDANIFRYKFWKQWKISSHTTYFRKKIQLQLDLFCRNIFISHIRYDSVLHYSAWRHSVCILNAYLNIKKTGNYKEGMKTNVVFPTTGEEHFTTFSFRFFWRIVLQKYILCRNHENTIFLKKVSIGHDWIYCLPNGINQREIPDNFMNRLNVI